MTCPHTLILLKMNLNHCRQFMTIDFKWSFLAVWANESGDLIKSVNHNDVCACVLEVSGLPYLSRLPLRSEEMPLFTT